MFDVSNVPQSILFKPIQSIFCSIFVIKKLLFQGRIWLFSHMVIDEFINQRWKEFI